MFGRTRNAVETQAGKQVYPQLFQVLPNFLKCLIYISIGTQKIFFLFLFFLFLRKYHNKIENNLFTLLNTFACAIIVSIAHASSVFHSITNAVL